MDTKPVHSLASLSPRQRSLLKKGNIVTVSDLVLLSVPGISRRCRIPHSEAKEMVDAAYESIEGPALLPLDDPKLPEDEVITTGSDVIDKAIGGGVVTGKLWEIVGESAAGKTQLAMQLSLCVQLPVNLGGVSGSACYLTTSWALPTNRIVEMLENHPALSPSLCSLENIHTVKTPTVQVLLHVLANSLPALLEQLSSHSTKKPVKLIVIDTLTELFRSDGQVSTATLIERSKDLTRISALLHTIANRHRIAIVALNEVSDIMRPNQPPSIGPAHEVRYADQAWLFNRADSIPGEGTKEAALGLVWANQVNCRVMLTRTNRMRVLDDDAGARPAKRQKLDNPHIVGTPCTRIRRLTVIFSAVAPPASADYIVNHCGVIGLEEQDEFSVENRAFSSPQRVTEVPAEERRIAENVEAFTLPLSVDGLQSEAPSSSEPEPALVDDEVGSGREPSNGVEEDEWEAYWKDTDIGSDIYSQIDLEALCTQPP